MIPGVWGIQQKDKEKIQIHIKLNWNGNCLHFKKHHQKQEKQLAEQEKIFTSVCVYMSVCLESSTWIHIFLIEQKKMNKNFEDVKMTYKYL